MKISRRQLLQRSTALGFGSLVPVWASGCGGGDGDNLPPLPTDLPVYSYDGTLGPETMFEHGVASGDPLVDGIVLWTRASATDAGTVDVWWEIALDQEFQKRVAQGTVTTNADVDYTAKVDVRGLIWGRDYYYRFFAQGRQSPVGRTRLIPEEGVDRVRFGVVSCASLAHGYFHAYRNLAQRKDIDAVLHLGDYIYEYGDGEYPCPDDSEPQLRLYEPSHEIISLLDYRTRYSQYRRDPDLQLLHQQMPFINVWDDHETADNAWMGGATNHNETVSSCGDPRPGNQDGDWATRKAIAMQVFFEWLPIREHPMLQIYRTFNYTSLVDLIMLDTRLIGREQQFPGILFGYGMTAPLPEQLMGPTQEAWLEEQLKQSTAKWRLLGQQVVMSYWRIGDQYANPDAWHGYPVARQHVLDMITNNSIENVVVLTGDVHSSWAMDVTPVAFEDYNPDTGAGAVAVEFVTPAITSPGSAVAASLINGAGEYANHIGFFETVSHGYMIVDVQQDKVQADWYYVDGLEENQGVERFGAAWATMSGAHHRIEMSGPESDGDGPALVSNA
ncbi:MAG: alkaline phosphatase D family protein [Polyangiales bacterium]